MQQIVIPKKVVYSKKAIRAKKLLISQEGQVGFDEPITTQVKDGSTIILDFGAELNGGIKVFVVNSDKTPVRIRFGESVGECCADIGEKNATNDHAIRDSVTFFPDWSMEQIGNTGFRFVRLDFTGKVIIKSIIAINNILDRQPIYSYSGDDILIKKIFDTAKRTIDLCTSSGYVWDGIKRDRLVWIGDLHPEMLALTALYGKSKEVERSMDYVKSKTPLPRWMNDFPTYSMWWIIILADYFRQTDEGAFVNAQLEYLSGLVKQMLDYVHEDGSMHYPIYFVDWPTRRKPDEIHGARAINVMAAKSAIWLLEKFNRDAAVAKKLLKHLLQEEIAPKTSKQAIALKYFAVGLSDEEREKLVSGGANGMSTFMAYYILKAVASFDKNKAIAMAKEYYGAMLKKGATTFWEDFDMEWLTEKSNTLERLPKADEKDIHGDYGSYCYKGFRHSLCHGWSSGVIAFIKEEC